MVTLLGMVSSCIEVWMHSLLLFKTLIDFKHRLLIYKYCLFNVTSNTFVLSGNFVFDVSFLQKGE